MKILVDAYLVLFLFTPFFLSLIVTYLKYCKLQHTIGTIIRIDRISRGSQIVFKEVIEYCPAGKSQKYEVQPKFGNVQCPKIGDIVDVYYSNEKPSKCIIGRVREIYFFPIVVLILTPIIGVIVLELSKIV